MWKQVIIVSISIMHSVFAGLQDIYHAGSRSVAAIDRFFSLLKDLHDDKSWQICLAIVLRDLLFAAVIVLTISTTYFSFLPWTEHTLNKPAGVVDALYFSLVTFTSLGY